MSSRALRKLQKQRENEKLAAINKEDSDSDAADIQETRKPAPKFNAFDLLNAGDEEQESDRGDEEDEVPQQPETPPEPSKPVEGKRKKKKKKAKKSAAAVASKPSEDADSELDDIDRALKELSTTGEAQQDKGRSLTGSGDNDLMNAGERNRLLSVDPKNLNAINEMKKLFGNVVLEGTEEAPQNNGPRRRRDRNRQGVDLGRALTGRYNPASGGQDLSGVASRKNVLMQGKGEWPRATSGGLGMEVVEKNPSGVTTFKILHNTAYNDVQNQFDACVESLDPQRLIQHLQFNPYHLSTLLQVSEIAKQQGDHSVSADLLERALFNIGRSAHSSFGACLKNGGARLDFKHQENRELWLAGWRYIINLGMKGTWRTAYEWAKLLLSLDSRDPYAIGLIIDQLALRGREAAQFIEFCTETGFGTEWENYPNIQCSLALAYSRQNKPKESRQQLHIAMAKYPWIFCRLAQELNIEPMPKKIWGKMPPNQSQQLLCELYIARAKDIWNTPETVGLIVEVADTLSPETLPIEPFDISLDVARHVLLSDIPAVTTHLPTHFTASRISSSDPLPPPNSESQYGPLANAPEVFHLPERDRPRWLQNLINEINPGNPSDALLQIARGAVRVPRTVIEALREELGDRMHDRPDGVDFEIPNVEHSDDGYDDEYDDEEEEEDLTPTNDLDRLIGQDLRVLSNFINVNGVDRGNWDEDLDIRPLTEYVRVLRRLIPSRRALYWSSIRDYTTPLVVDLVTDELERQEDEEGETQ
ncbi:hypothetical protein FQN54_009505 [Arachnomyces sp. PD_36]|nr:hypothetical protein FQN54_009505 [Arachnomyces sp. PD_36]